MSKLKTSDVKVMISRTTAAKIAPLAERIESVEEIMGELRDTLKAIQKRLGAEADPVELVEVPDARAHPLARNLNPLLFPSNRRAIEKVFAKRGFRQGDTVESVLREAKGAYR